MNQKAIAALELIANAPKPGADTKAVHWKLRQKLTRDNLIGEKLVKGKKGQMDTVVLVILPEGKKALKAHAKSQAIA